MKKITTITLAAITILTVLFSFIPMSTVFAEKEDTVVGLLVRNRTGGVVEIKLIDENGNPAWFVYQPGQTTTSLPEGKYFYYAVTPCGNQSGDFNINVTKELIFSCRQGLEIELSVPEHKGGSDLCYPVYDYTFIFSDNPQTNTELIAIFASPFVWGSIGTHCQPNPANSGDTIPFYNPNRGATSTYYYEPVGVECFQAGNGFYYKPCPETPR